MMGEPERPARDRGIHHRRALQSPLRRNSLKGRREAQPTHDEAAARRSFEVRAEIIASLGAAGILLYVMLRFPYAVFYYRLGTTPEEVGLGYTQTLTQSSAAVAAVFLISAAYTWIMAEAGGGRGRMETQRRKEVKRSPRPKVFRKILAKMDDKTFEAHKVRVQEYWSRTPAERAVHDSEMPLRIRLRQMDRMTKPTAENRREAAGIIEQLDEASGGPVHHKTREFLKASIFGTILVLLLVMPLLAWDAADDVRSCGDGITIPGFQAGGQHVELFEPDNTPAVQFTGRHLILLGGDSSRYVLYDCNQRATLRVPTSNYIVVNAIP